MYTADVPFGTVGGSVIRTASVPPPVEGWVAVEVEEWEVETEEFETVVRLEVELGIVVLVFSRPAPTTELIRAIAIIAAARPETITLLVELIWVSSNVEGTRTNVFELYCCGYEYLVLFLVRSLFNKIC